jgi:uncharacterized membrane protein YhhN
MKYSRENACWLWILLGLLVSSVGDVFMVWRSQLVNGMAAFALGQLCYIKAFGFTPLKPKIAAALFASTSAGAQQIKYNNIYITATLIHFNYHI